MAAAATWRARFLKDAQELNYGRRVKQLVALGQELAQQVPADAVEEVVGALPHEDTFSALSALAVAQGADSGALPARLLAHPSQAVRFKAATLLRPGDAERAFLSEDSNQQLKTWLVRSSSLPCTPEVLQHAQRLFSPDVVWLVLQRTADERLFEEWVGRLPSLWPSYGLPGLARLAAAFPDSFLRLLDASRFAEQSWVWIVNLAQRRPTELLERVCVTYGGRKLANSREDLTTRLLTWAWRHQHAAMVRICAAVAASHAPAAATTRSWATAHGLVAIQQGLMTSHSCPTIRRKIETVVTVYLALPEEQKGVATAKEFLELVPDARKHGAAELVDAYWQIVDDLGRGRLPEAVRSGLFATVARKLPPPLAVEQFFRILRDFEPESSVYHFVQSEVCKTADGRHDRLMLSVFERFLQSNLPRSAAAACVEMFQALVKDAVSMDVVQTAFDLLTARLGGATERTLLRDVIHAMKVLDARVTAAAKQGLQPPPAGSAIPAPTLPLPTGWLRFLPCLEGGPPYAAFLQGALDLWARDGAALQTAVDRFGTALFWSTFEHVLAHALGKASVASVQWDKGRVDVALLSQVVLIAPVAKPLKLGGQADAAAAAGAGGAEPPQVVSVYFTGLEAKKNESFGRDVEKRQEAYSRLVKEASREENVLAAFDDLLAFLVNRFGGEQENVQFAVIGHVLPAFDVKVWTSRCSQLRSLWKVWSKARGSGARDAWEVLGNQLVKHALLEWEEGQPAPSEACLLGVEVAQGSVDFGGLFAASFKDGSAKRGAAAALCDPAVQWLVQTAVPLPKQSEGLLVGEDAARHPLEEFCAFITRMAEAAVPAGKGAERALWERWPFLGRWWDALLGSGLSLVGAEYLLAGAVSHWAGRQPALARRREGRGGKCELWWEPVACPAYAAAVGRVLLQMETGEIPDRAGAAMLARRSQAVQVMEATARTDSGTAGRPDRHDWSRCPALPWHALSEARVHRTCPEAPLLGELAVLGKLLGRGGAAARQVQWCVIHAVEGLQGEASDALLEALIGQLDARREGLAGCVARQYPYLNAALADEEEAYPAYSQNREAARSCDLLTPALELWLRDTKTRDERIARVMDRQDVEYLLFFGNSFAEHLSVCRQEWLHRCLEKLRAPPESDEAGECYHHAQRLPSLVRVAQLGKGWKHAASVHDPSRTDTQCVQTFFWHRETQALFLQKGLVTTDMSTLAIIPSLQFVDGIERAGELLERHPFEQKGPVHDGGWTVIQPTGNCQELWPEVERRFLEAGSPGLKNAIGDREADQLLVNLGRADHADRALKILGKYACKFKKAKEALVQALPNLSPSHARRVIEEVCFAPEAGVSLQVAALKLLMELQVPNPLQLYRVAWRDGVCHRDVAAIILKKVAVSPATDWAPDEVRDMFDIFDPSSAAQAAKADAAVPVPAGKKYPEGTYQAMSAAKQDNWSYIANIVLEGLAATPLGWSLPFLPEVVGRLAMLPGSTDEAVRALKAHRGEVSETLAALTVVTRQARLAALAQKEVSDSLSVIKAAWGAKADTARLLAQLSKYAPGAPSALVKHVKGMSLGSCSAAALRGFVDELLRWHAASMAWPRAAGQDEALKDALEVWVRLLHRPQQPGVDLAEEWERTLREMEREVAARGGAEDLGMLAAVVAQHVRSLGLSWRLDGPWALRAVRECFERVLGQLAELGLGKQGDEIDEACQAERKKLAAVQTTIAVEHWAELVGQGCSAEEAARLFERCPRRSAVQLARNVVKAAGRRLGDGKAEQLAGEASAWQALRWLAGSEPRAYLGTLAQLWPQVLESDADGEALESVLQLFGRYPACPQGIELVAEVLKLAPRRHWLPALRWLGGIFPRDAARLWPKVLLAGDAEADAAKDVAELLQLCEAHNLEPPQLPDRTCAHPAVLRLLAASPLAAARLAAVRALRQLDLRGKHAAQKDLLAKLAGDGCGVVAAAAEVALGLACPDEDKVEGVAVSLF